MTQDRKAIAYYRVSTEHQGESGFGMAAQQVAVEGACNQNRWPIVASFRDVKSGKNMRRTGLAQALSDMAAGKADILVAAKLDRISRSVVDFGKLVETAQKQGWSLVVLDLGLDMSTPAGELMANMLVSIAQFERRRIGERIKEAMAQVPREPHYVTLRNGDKVLKQAPGGKRR